MISKDPKSERFNVICQTQQLRYREKEKETFQRQTEEEKKINREKGSWSSEQVISSRLRKKSKLASKHFRLKLAPILDYSFNQRERE